MLFLAESTIQLVPDATLLLHLVFIAVMVFVLNRTLLRPINEILARREKEISGPLTEAEQLTAEAEEKLTQYNAALREARGEGYKLLEKERAAALKEKDDKVRQHREQLSRTVEQQLEATQRQQDQVRAELEGQAATMGGLISSQILRGPAQH
ncbi:MAG TPA: ATP synthase F0 subunit B [Pyrinomonadaceae bacterium]|nr:ATP synthase F0 subunit B [Pyrinomonadaceae bacterium]